MIFNYFKIAYRNITKYKVFSFINITGLAIGLACLILISLFIQDEFSYDRFHKKAENIYRLTAADEIGAMPTWAGTPLPAGPTLKKEFPEVTEYIRFNTFPFKPKILISSDSKKFFEDKFWLADPNVFNVFDFNLIKGDPANALKSPYNVVLSETIAKKYFGDEDPIGKILNFDNETEFTVSGVFKDVPDNSTIKFDFLGSILCMNELYGFDVFNNWGMYNYYTFLQLSENTDPDDFTIKASHYLQEMFNEEDIAIHIAPITDLHLYSSGVRDRVQHSDISIVYYFSIIALLILLIASINFMNLYTANSELRAKEIGLRKVVGANKNQLVFQIMSEAILFSLIALPIALLIARIVLPYLNFLTGKNIYLDFMNDYVLFTGVFIIAILTGIISGLYPALFISSMSPTEIISRGRLRSGKKGFTFRNILVVFQFAVSIFLITSTLLVDKQMQYVRNKKLGYDKENIVNIPMHDDSSKSNSEVFKSEIISHTNVIGASATSFRPSVEKWREAKYFEGRTDEDDLAFFRMSCDYDFIDVFGLEVIAGRKFNKNYPTDLGNAYILNHTAVKEIGWTPEEAVGKAFSSEEGRVVGIVKDFNYQSLRRETKPLAINIHPRLFYYLSIKINSGDIGGTLDFIERKWHEVNPNTPFEYYFFDEEFDKLYKADERMENLLSAFSFIAIFLACMGLFGLSLFKVHSKLKEIGIRKVIGASTTSLMMLLLKDLLKLILVGILAAVPAIYFVMSDWLQEFAYRIDIEIFVFIISGAITLLIALATVSYQVIRAANTNPVDVLKYE